MAKQPQPGSTKTRLTPAMNSQEAADFYAAMLDDVVSSLSLRNDATLMIAAGSDSSVPWFEETFPGVPVVSQGEGVLGERLDRVLSNALAAGHCAAFAISSDSPDLPESHLSNAFAMLDADDIDVVLGPSEDGGYWTIGWKQRWTDMVVGVEMSRPDVLENSVRIAEASEARVGLAAPWYDVDEIADVERLAAALPSARLPRLSELLAVKPIGAPRFLSVVIPALNEAENIADVVHGLLEEGVDQVIVVDNGSTDDTAGQASAAGADVVTEPRRGYGYACAAGTSAALAAGATVVGYIDGDQSSRPSELASLVDPIVSGEARLVLGSRTKGNIASGAMPPHQRAGNTATAALMRLLYRVDVSDLGPYRAIDATLLSELEMTEMTFGWPTEMMVKAARRGEVIREVPVSWDTRAAGTSKVGGSVKGSILAGWAIIRVTLRHARSSGSGTTAAGKAMMDRT